MSKTYLTKTWKLIEVSIDNFHEEFNYYEDVECAFNTRDYCVLWNFTEYEVDYLCGKIDFDENERNDKLEKLKLDKIIVWFNIIDYRSNWVKIRRVDTIESDWFIIFDKDSSDEYVKTVFDEFEKRFNWEIYRVSVYAPVYYKSIDKDVFWKINYVKQREFIDWCSWFFDFDEAKNSYWEEIIEKSESDWFSEFIQMSESEYKEKIKAQNQFYLNNDNDE